MPPKVQRKKKASSGVELNQAGYSWNEWSSDPPQKNEPAKSPADSSKLMEVKNKVQSQKEATSCSVNNSLTETLKHSCNITFLPEATPQDVTHFQLASGSGHGESGCIELQATLDEQELPVRKGHSFPPSSRAILTSSHGAVDSATNHLHSISDNFSDRKKKLLSRLGDEKWEDVKSSSYDISNTTPCFSYCSSVNHDSVPRRPLSCRGVDSDCSTLTPQRNDFTMHSLPLFDPQHPGLGLSHEQGKEKSRVVKSTTVSSSLLPQGVGYASSSSSEPLLQVSDRARRNYREKIHKELASSTVPTCPSSFSYASKITPVTNFQDSIPEREEVTQEGCQILQTGSKDSVNRPPLLASVKIPVDTPGFLMGQEERTRKGPAETSVSSDSAFQNPLFVSVHLDQKFVRASTSPASSRSSYSASHSTLEKPISPRTSSKAWAAFPILSRSSRKSAANFSENVLTPPPRPPSPAFPLLPTTNNQDEIPNEIVSTVTQQTGAAHCGAKRSPSYGSHSSIGNVLIFSATSSAVIKAGDRNFYSMEAKVGNYSSAKETFRLDENELKAANYVLPIICCPLENLGNSCYFNSVIQLLASCPAFVYALRNSVFARSQRVCATSVECSSATTPKLVKSVFSGSEKVVEKNCFGSLGKQRSAERGEADGEKEAIGRVPHSDRPSSSAYLASPTEDHSSTSSSLYSVGTSGVSPCPKNYQWNCLESRGECTSTEPLWSLRQQFYKDIGKLLFTMEFSSESADLNQCGAVVREATLKTLDMLGTLSPTFEGRFQQDAAEMISTVLSALEDESSVGVDVSVLFHSFLEDRAKIEDLAPSQQYHYFYQIRNPHYSRWSSTETGLPLSLPRSQLFHSFLAGKTSSSSLYSLFCVQGQTIMLWCHSPSFFPPSTKQCDKNAEQNRWSEGGLLIEDGVEKMPGGGASGKVDGPTEECKGVDSSEGNSDTAGFKRQHKRVLSAYEISSAKNKGKGGNSMKASVTALSASTLDPRQIPSLLPHHQQRGHPDQPLRSPEEVRSKASGAQSDHSPPPSGKSVADDLRAASWGTNSFHWMKFLTFVEQINCDNQQLESIARERQEKEKQIQTSCALSRESVKSGGSRPNSLYCSSTTPPAYRAPKLHFHDVTDVFSGYTVSETTCHHCSNASRSVHAFQVLLLDIPSKDEWIALQEQKKAEECCLPSGSWRIVNEGCHLPQGIGRNEVENGSERKGFSVARGSLRTSGPLPHQRTQSSLSDFTHKISRNSSFRETRGCSQPVTSKDLEDFENYPLAEVPLFANSDVEYSALAKPVTESKRALRSYDAQIVDHSFPLTSSPSHSRTSSGVASVNGSSAPSKKKKSNLASWFSGFLQSVKQRISSSPTSPRTLWECMYHHFAPYHFDAQNLYKCEACGMSAEATKKEYIAHLPETLLVQMKRFEGGVFVNSKKGDPVKFSLSWDPMSSATPFSLSTKDYVLDLAEFIHPELRDTYRGLDDEEKRIPHSFADPASDGFSKGWFSPCDSASGGPTLPSSDLRESLTTTTPQNSRFRKAESTVSAADTVTKLVQEGERGNTHLPLVVPSDEGASFFSGEVGVEALAPKGRTSSITESFESDGLFHVKNASMLVDSNENFSSHLLTFSSQGYGNTKDHAKSSTTGNPMTSHHPAASDKTMRAKMHFNASPSRPLTCPRASYPVSTYTLVGVINHHGSLSSGHYTTYARKENSEGKSTWLFLNDESVVPVDESEVEDAEEYILMYRQQSVVKRPNTVEERLKQIARNLLQTTGKFPSFYFTQEGRIQHSQGPTGVEASLSSSQEWSKKGMKTTTKSSSSSPSSTNPEVRSDSTVGGPNDKLASLPPRNSASSRVYLSRSWLHRAAFLGDPGPIINRVCYCSDADKRKPLISDSQLPLGVPPYVIVNLKEHPDLPHVHTVPLEWFYISVTLEDYFAFYNYYGGNAWVTVEEIDEMLAQQLHFKKQLEVLLEEMQQNSLQHA